MKFNNHPEDQTKIPGNSLAQEVTTKIIFCHSGIKRSVLTFTPCMYTQKIKLAIVNHSLEMGKTWPAKLLCSMICSCIYLITIYHKIWKSEDHKVLMESRENTAHSSCVHSLTCPHECSNPVSVNQICFLLKTIIYLVTSYYFYSKVDYSCKNQWLEDTNMLQNLWWVMSNHD